MKGKWRLICQKEESPHHFHVSVRELLKENIPKVGQEEQDPFLSLLDPWTLVQTISTYWDIWETRYTNLESHSPFENDFHIL
jgi:hypothetical protein